MKSFLVAAVLLAILHPAAALRAAEWQWSVADGKNRDFLWIPSNCSHVRAVVVCNHNMIEPGILEHPLMRKTLSELGIAEVWAVPTLDMVFDFNKGAGDHLTKVLDALADESGYDEIKTAPIIPMGHSACATYPWNCGAWNPQRTLAMISVHGDAPQTKLTGYGRPNIDWGNRSIDGVPGLMVMGEYEWREDRLSPALEFQAGHPAVPMAFLADAGHGHFDYSDALVSYLCLFIRKAVVARLPADASTSQPAVLRPVHPTNGWRIDRWHRDAPPTASAAPYSQYAGDPKTAFWCFDEEMARASEAYYASARGKKPQLVAFVQNGQLFSGEPCSLKFLPADDGISFHLEAQFLDVVTGSGGNPARWAGQPNGTALGHATAGGPIILSKIVGPCTQTGPRDFQVQLDRMFTTEDRRKHDLCLLASHGGDDHYKSCVQQGMIRLQPNTTGSAQKITFPEIPNQPLGTSSVALTATSDSKLSVHYYVREGPAEIDGCTLRLLPIPPRSRFPVKVTVVAWQWGRSTDPRVQTAPQEQVTFSILPDKDSGVIMPLNGSAKPSTTQPATKAVDDATTQSIYYEVKTPFKYGVVIEGDKDELVDRASLFRSGGRWYMMYVASVKETGYQTHLARIDDLLDWERLGVILPFSTPTDWGRNRSTRYSSHAVPFPSLLIFSGRMCAMAVANRLGSCCL